MRVCMYAMHTFMYYIHMYIHAYMHTYMHTFLLTERPQTLFEWRSLREAPLLLSLQGHRKLLLKRI